MANLVLGLFSPFKYGLTEYEKYDITRFKNNIRFLLVIEDRDNGAGGQVCPLLFDGEVSNFCELPLPDNKREIESALQYVEQVIRRRATPIFMILTREFSREKRKVVRGLHRWFNRSIFASKKKS